MDARPNQRDWARRCRRPQLSSTHCPSTSDGLTHIANNSHDATTVLLPADRRTGHPTGQAGCESVVQMYKCSTSQKNKKQNNVEERKQGKMQGEICQRRCPPILRMTLSPQIILRAIVIGPARTSYRSFVLKCFSDQSQVVDTYCRIKKRCLRWEWELQGQIVLCSLNPKPKTVTRD